MKTSMFWFGCGVGLAVAGAAWGAEGLWLGEDDRVAVVSRAAGEEWVSAAGVLQECAAMEIPFAVFYGTLGEGERAAVAEAAAEGEWPDGTEVETGAGFERLGESLAAFDPSYVFVAGWAAGEGIPAGVAEALEESPAQVLAGVAGGGEVETTLADFQRKSRDQMLGLFGKHGGGGAVESFRRWRAEDYPVAEAGASGGTGAPAVEEESAVEEGAAAVDANVGRVEEAAGTMRLRPRTRLPAAPKAKSLFEQPVKW